MIEIGVNIVEIVTKGLYTNSLDIFREYIQNSCDAIDDAVDAGILQENDGKIEIDINADARRITIKDNGMGIPKRYFEKTMSKIGNSDKTLETDRGFRGIGRLCGLAYCREARFLSTAKGETKLSIMTINAEGLRKEFFSDNKHSAESVLRDVMKYDGEGTEEVDEHFFCVELIDIVGTNNILLDVDKVREYLSFVAPVDYKQSLGFKGLQNKILEHATELNFKISSYNIFVNGEHLYKPYKSNFRTTHNGADEVFDLEFHLIPNSRRDYFEENEACNVFEAKLKKYFAELYKIYHTASEIRSSYRAIAVPSEVEHEFTNQSVTYQKSHRMEHEAELARLKKNAKKAESKLTEIRQKAEQSPVTLLARVVFHMTERPSVNISSPARSTDKPIEAPTFPPSTWSRDLRKLYTAIETVILDNPKLSGKILLDKIKTELAK